MKSNLPNPGKNVIAAFDFDGTITKKDTLPIFIRFSATTGRLILGTLKMIPYLLCFKLKIIPNFQAKEKLFNFFFAGMTLEAFNKLGHSFCTKIKQIINADAMDRIQWHQRNGHKVIIISASPENWIKPWAIKNGIQTVIATKLQIKNDVITGNFLTKNCHGKEKVMRLLEEFPARKEYILYAYGDSNGDKELLSAADYAFYRCFTK